MQTQSSFGATITVKWTTSRSTASKLSAFI
jgi:hypothetical protein